MPLRISLIIFLFVVLLQIPSDFLIAKISAPFGIFVDEVVFIFIMPILILKMSGYDPISILPLGKAGGRRILVAVCMTLGAALVLGYLRAFSADLIPIPDLMQRFKPRPIIVRSWSDFFPNLVLLCVIAPFCEEVLFRGILQRSISKRAGHGVAIVLTAILFSLLHSTSFEPHLYFLLGLLFAWIYEMTGALRIAIICHAINNTWVVANQIHGLDFPIYGEMGTTDVALLIGGAVVMMSSAAWLMKIKRTVRA